MSSDTFEIGLGRATPPLVMALDIGSTASRGALFDATGRPVKPRAKFAHAFATSADGTSIMDPEEVVQEVAALITDLVDTAADRPIAGVALDTFASSLIGVDANGLATTPCYNYNDNRCASEVAGLREDADEDEVQTRTGCRFHASYLPARLRWLARTEPATWRDVHRWVSLGEYIHLRLLSEAVAGTSTAAWSGLLNRATGDWDPPTLELAGIDASRLSPIGDPNVSLRPRPGSSPTRTGRVAARPLVPADR